MVGAYPERMASSHYTTLRDTLADLRVREHPIGAMPVCFSA